VTDGVQLGVIHSLDPEVPRRVCCEGADDEHAKDQKTEGSPRHGPHCSPEGQPSPVTSSRLNAPGRPRSHLPASRRTTAGYRVYGPATLSTLAFVAQTRRLGFHLGEIKEVVQIRCSGRCPCPHVLDLVRQKVEELDRTLAELTEVRRGLQGLLGSSSRSPRRGGATVCHHIERLKIVKGRR